MKKAYPINGKHCERVNSSEERDAFDQAADHFLRPKWGTMVQRKITIKVQTGVASLRQKVTEILQGTSGYLELLLDDAQQGCSKEVSGQKTADLSIAPEAVIPTVDLCSTAEICCINRSKTNRKK